MITEKTVVKKGDNSNKTLKLIWTLINKETHEDIYFVLNKKRSNNCMYNKLILIIVLYIFSAPFQIVKIANLKHVFNFFHFFNSFNDCLLYKQQGTI